MNTLTRTSRVTGAAYLGLAVFGMLGFLVTRPQLFVPTDADATLANLIAQPSLANLGIALELLVVISQAIAAVGFFALIAPERPAAGFGVAAFGMGNAIVILGSAGLLTAALAVASDPTLAPGGDTAATTQLLFTLSAIAWKVGGVFFGLWLIPMGWFAISTRRMPRILGWILVIGGVGYLVNAFLSVAVQQAPSVLVDLTVIPATIGELWVVGYLLVRGIRPHKLSA